ncbi:Sucrose operon repressor ScrR, LacI family protein [Lapidilactobacillus dextrinicus DSM 20335]|uniref:Sucrose operon repressor ScrR, LacI family protein n=1 Tax=Lapidilactobacillus dextrinicus DSM 20335 TaxID=1423738 RepID=A0A0R2BT37_9LACO|nr:LacI family DNA-binding transcriptional regulator [Lapidilactobacillus dextrinicus]KRM78643.1 Sucrose operon repressor ScrR, LacI family protein [Lapidilactobacillus dextrinicus DSM 20335]QFG46575.1 LacI family transcriptional regulator [Lapidilactobacillus dextrinicus]
MKPKLDDVALEAGVSKTTVSRVLNNRGYLSEKTKQKVYAAMEKLNYHPNEVARQLFENRTHLIGLIFPTTANPFFGELIAKIEENLFLAGYKALICNSMNSPQKEREYLQMLISNQVDGIIVGAHNTGIKEYQTVGLPIISIDRFLSDQIPIISSDNYEGGRLATEYLFAHGARQIIHTNGPIEKNAPTMLRKKAYEDVMQEHQMMSKTYTIDLNMTDVEKNQHIQQIFAENPEVDGIFASNDLDAISIMNMAKKFKRQVPQELLVVGYDGTQVIQNIYPQLPTVVQPINEMALKSVEMLLKLLKDEPVTGNVTLPVRLSTSH